MPAPRARARMVCVDFFMLHTPWSALLSCVGCRRALRQRGSHAPGHSFSSRGGPRKRSGCQNGKTRPFPSRGIPVVVRGMVFLGNTKSQRDHINLTRSRVDNNIITITGNPGVSYATFTAFAGFDCHLGELSIVPTAAHNEISSCHKAVKAA